MVTGTSVGYISATGHVPLPKQPEKLHTTHRPWCADCKRKHDAEDLNDDGLCARCARAAVSRAAAAERRTAEAAEMAALERRHRAEVAAQARQDSRPTPRLPKEGKQGQPPTRSSAPRGTASMDSGEAPGAGPSTHREKNPPAAQETRPAAAGGPSDIGVNDIPTNVTPATPTFEANLDAQIQHVTRLLRATADHPHTLVRALRTNAIAALEALHLAHELHQTPAATTSTPVASGRPAAGTRGGEAPRQPATTGQGVRRDLPAEELAAQYRAGKTLRDLADIYGCSSPVIARHLDQVGVVRRGSPVPRTPELVAQIRQLYVYDKLTLDEVGERIGYTAKLVTTILREQGIPLRPSASKLSEQGIGRPIKIQPDQYDTIVDRYRGGESAPSIALSYDVSNAAIYYILSKVGVDERHGTRTLGTPADHSRGLKDQIARLGVTSRQIKDWAVAGGLLDDIRVGLPAQDLVDAYALAHPTTEGGDTAA